MNGFRPKRFAERVGHKGREVPPQARWTSFRPGTSTVNADHALAFDVVRHADDGGFGDRVMRNQNRFDLGRSDALSGDLQRVVAAAEDVPVPVLVALRPVAVRPRCLAIATSRSRDSALDR